VYQEDQPELQSGEVAATLELIVEEISTDDINGPL